MKRLEPLALVAAAAVALTACARSESARDAATAVKDSGDEHDRSREERAALEAERMRDAGARGRAAATREMARSDASEARRAAAN